MYLKYLTVTTETENTGESQELVTRSSVFTGRGVRHETRYGFFHAESQYSEGFETSAMGGRRKSISKLVRL